MPAAFRLCLFSLLLAALCLAQPWEIGGVGGGGFLTNASVSGAAGSALAGFQPGAAIGAVASHNVQKHFSGEIRYTFLQSGLKLSSGGTAVNFSGVAHAVHYDVLLHPRPRRGAPLPFLALGGGVKVFRGTGPEASYQPLHQYAYLTKTQQVEPLISAGAGVKIPLSPNLFLRAEFRDYLTPFPTQVIAAAPGEKVGGWLHNLVPLVGLTFAF
ncbi:MAG TPA: hypothetical protein VFA33_16530 [Bryobacteraceae bacterium]|nr:hypothetical protein [Bryobacteraceae bacterium]